MKDYVESLKPLPPPIVLTLSLPQLPCAVTRVLQRNPSGQNALARGRPGAELSRKFRLATLPDLIRFLSTLPPPITSPTTTTTTTTNPPSTLESWIRGDFPMDAATPLIKGEPTFPSPSARWLLEPGASITLAAVFSSSQEGRFSAPLSFGLAPTPHTVLTAHVTGICASPTISADPLELFPKALKRSKAGGGQVLWATRRFVLEGGGHLDFGALPMGRSRKSLPGGTSAEGSGWGASELLKCIHSSKLAAAAVKHIHSTAAAGAAAASRGHPSSPPRRNNKNNSSSPQRSTSSSSREGGESVGFPISPLVKVGVGGGEPPSELQQQLPTLTTTPADLHIARYQASVAESHCVAMTVVNRGLFHANVTFGLSGPDGSTPYTSLDQAVTHPSPGITSSGSGVVDGGVTRSLPAPYNSKDATSGGTLSAGAILETKGSCFIIEPPAIMGLPPGASQEVLIWSFPPNTPQGVGAPTPLATLFSNTLLARVADSPQCISVPLLALGTSPTLTASLIPPVDPNHHHHHTTVTAMATVTAATATAAHELQQAPPPTPGQKAPLHPPQPAATAVPPAAAGSASGVVALCTPGPTLDFGRLSLSSPSPVPRTVLLTNTSLLELAWRLNDNRMNTTTTSLPTDTTPPPLRSAPPRPPRTTLVVVVLAPPMAQSLP